MRRHGAFYIWLGGIVMGAPSLFAEPAKPATETAVFGAGCFWGVEAAFREKKGVVNTAVGFMGGTTKDPTYEEVCTHTTGHAEVVKIDYDPSVVSYRELLDLFWSIHDPTTPNRQGPDVGSQYRSAIYTFTSAQAEEARASMEAYQKSGVFNGPIVTQIVPAAEFYRAEEYHQRYYEKTGLKGGCPL